MRSPIVFGDIPFERRNYDPQAAYAQSKTATSLFAVEAARRWAPDGIVANAVNPGGVATGCKGTSRRSRRPRSHSRNWRSVRFGPERRAPAGSPEPDIGASPPMA
jgi:NAD(P)-dependent dehydrogenase (short-subunit alcohol dehydrogenase family)